MPSPLVNIKIARIATVPYAIATQIGDQVAYLRDIGMQVVIISADGPELVRFPFSESLRHECIDIPRSISPWKDILALIQLIKIYRKHQFDIIHSTTPKAGLLSAVAGFLARIPIRLHTFTGQPWITRKGIVRIITRLCDRIIGILNTKCYADSGSQKDFLVDEGIISKNKIDVIGAGSLAGVDLKRFDPARWDLEEKTRLRDDLHISTDSQVLIFVGRMTRDKGIAELAEAFYSLVQNNYNVDLLLIGPLDQERGGKESISIDKITKIPKIRYVGYTDCPEKYLAISNIFCLPSYREGFGTAVLEAAAMGVPCVATRIYGLTDAVQHGDTGLLVPPRDVDSLRDTLKYLLEQPELTKQMGKAARERVVKDFDAGIINDKTAAEYSNLLQQRKSLHSAHVFKDNILYDTMKRTFDIFMSLTLLLILFIPLLFVSILVKLTSHGPVLYWSDRAGKNNTIFKMPKFRTMKINTPAVATHLLTNPDQFLTPIGKLLRKSSSDEIPQLFSILKGDMSFVGPRPALFNQHDLIALRTERSIHTITPGLTGWAQVNGRDELPVRMKVDFDEHYLYHRSFLFDMKILFMTLFKVIRGEGVQH